MRYEKYEGTKKETGRKGLAEEKEENAKKKQGKEETTRERKGRRTKMKSCRRQGRWKSE